VLPDGGNSIIIVSRANAAITVVDVEAASEILTSSKVLSVQLELPVEASRTALRLASTAGATTILTPAPVGPVDQSLASYVDILVPNEVEAAALTGLDCDDESQVPMIARKLAEDWDLRACVVTLGSRGAFVLDRAGWRTGSDSWTPYASRMPPERSRRPSTGPPIRRLPAPLPWPCWTPAHHEILCSGSGLECDPDDHRISSGERV
jgi:sugar/nucleoside kinase (ribokinase family)